MNEHLKEIRSGFLRRVGAAILLGLSSILPIGTLTGINLSAFPQTIVSIRLLLAALGIFWLGRLSCSFGTIKIHKAV
jgi:ABC-type antimicrobial peptide transport system permease subunit